MDSRVQRAAQDFITNLTDASATETQKYIAEIISNREFHNRLEENRSNFGGQRYFSWGMGIGTTLGTVLYALCRKLKPDAAVETGVASGVSSAYILCALEENKHGELYSIDLPWQETMTYPRRYYTSEGLSRETTSEKESGWIIPDYLRHRWQLIRLCLFHLYYCTDLAMARRCRCGRRYGRTTLA